MSSAEQANILLVIALIAILSLLIYVVTLIKQRDEALEQEEYWFRKFHHLEDK